MADRECVMNRIVFVWLVVFAAMWVGLAAQSTSIKIGNAKINIPQPLNSGPALSQSEIRELDLLGTDDLKVWAVYGASGDVHTLVESKNMPRLPDPVFLVFGISALDDETLDYDQVSTLANSIAASLADGMSDSDPVDPYDSISLGTYWESDFGLGHTIKMTGIKSKKSFIWLICPVLVQGKMLCLLGMQNYTDEPALEALQETTVDWAEQIYVANGGVLPGGDDGNVGYVHALTPMDTPEDPGIDNEDEYRKIEFVDYEDPPVIIGEIRPVYPKKSKRAGIQGTVILEVEVYKDGVAGEIKVLQSVQTGPKGLDQAAIEAVRKVRFMPGIYHGSPIDSKIIIPIEFKLD